MKRRFDYIDTADLRLSENNKSILFGAVPSQMMKELKREYAIEKGDEKRTSAEAEERMAPFDRITRLMRKYSSRLANEYETVIIDEAHFLRNLLAYWGMGACLLGLLSKVKSMKWHSFAYLLIKHLPSHPIFSLLLGPTFLKSELFF